MDDLRRQLYQATGWRRDGLQAFHPHLPAMERLLFGGLETRTDPADYYWDGQRRGCDPHHPFIVFQYTLTGWGIYEDAAGVRRLPPGHAFLAVVPSAHAYYLPRESDGWSFFYLLLQHPYVVERLTELVRKHGAVAELPPESPVIHRAAALFEGLCLRSFADALGLEGAMFDFMLEYQRHLARPEAPAQREQWLLGIREQLMKQLRRPLQVEQLARRHNLSRSNYSHAFRRITGRTPAEYVAELRLQEVSRQLLQTGASLRE